MMLYVPIYALMARITFIGNNKYNYTELIIVFLYVQAQISILSGFAGVILVALGISQGIISIFSIPLMILYSAFFLKRL